MQLKDNSLRSYNYGAGVIVGRSVKKPTKFQQ
jgi:hypothetical protein